MITLNKKVGVGAVVLGFGAISWFVSSCETIPTPAGNSTSLEQPKLPTSLYDYTWSNIMGRALDIKQELMNNAKNRFGGFGF